MATGTPGASTPATEGLRDPVCGMRVAADAPQHTRHAGVDYRFCCAGCLNKFEANPTAFLAEPASATAHDDHVAMHTCPMHPQILHEGPGRCPLCGMALEAVLPAASLPQDPELQDMQRRFLFSLPFSILLMLLAWIVVFDMLRVCWRHVRSGAAASTTEAAYVRAAHAAGARTTGPAA